jgi:hypothetical protein
LGQLGLSTSRILLVAMSGASIDGGGGGEGGGGGGGGGGGKKDAWQIRAEAATKGLVVKQIHGSVAGAGSGDFQRNRKLRRQELERLARMDREAAAETAAAEFRRTQERLDREAAEATARKAAKRRRKKEAARAAKKRARVEATNKFANDGSFLERALAGQTAKQDGDGDGGAGGADTEQAAKRKSEVETATAAESANAK